MLRIKFLLLLILVVVSTASASVELYSFQAFAVVNQARLEWTTGTEDNFSHFVVERSSDGVSFFEVGNVPSTGSFSGYSFVDASPLDVDMDRTFYYRLRMTDRNGVFRYSEVQQVSLSFTGLRHTWGSIKAMFR